MGAEKEKKCHEKKKRCEKGFPLSECTRLRLITAISLGFQPLNVVSSASNVSICHVISVSVRLAVVWLVIDMSMYNLSGSSIGHAVVGACCSVSFDVQSTKVGILRSNKVFI